MTLHDPLVRVRHMIDHASEAIDMLGLQSIEELRDNRMLQLALVQLIEIVAEAASRVPVGILEANPSIPWQLAADRNKLIHGYDVVEYAIVYDTVKEDLPPLVQQLETLLPDFQTG
jgi:uncharacterized protein with HEPN domain